jgi:hypothetical protein
LLDRGGVVMSAVRTPMPIHAYYEAMHADQAFTQECERQFGKGACDARYRVERFDAATLAAWNEFRIASNRLHYYFQKSRGEIE